MKKESSNTAKNATPNTTASTTLPYRKKGDLGILGIGINFDSKNIHVIVRRNNPRALDILV